MVEVLWRRQQWPLQGFNTRSLITAWVKVSGIKMQANETLLKVIWLRIHPTTENLKHYLRLLISPVTQWFAYLWVTYWKYAEFVWTVLECELSVNTMPRKHPGLMEGYLKTSAKTFLSVSRYDSQARERRKNVFHGWKGWNESAPDRTRQRQVQDQSGGMDDGKIRNKLKNRPNRKSREGVNGEASPGKAESVVDAHVYRIDLFIEQLMYFEQHSKYLTTYLLFLSSF